MKTREIYNKLIARFDNGMWPCIEVWPFSYVKQGPRGPITVRSSVRLQLAANTPASLVKAIYNKEQMVPKGAIDPYASMVVLTREPGSVPREGSE